MQHTFNQPSPSRIISSLAAFQLSSAMRAAIEFDLFTAIAQGHNDAEKLAAHCKISPRGARILADYLTMNQYLAKQGGQYTLTPEAALYLDRRSPSYVGGPIGFVQAPHVLRHFESLEDRIRDGGAPRQNESALAPDDYWVNFARNMAQNMAAPSIAVARHILAQFPPTPPQPLKVLDIAASHGLFGIAFAQQYPDAQISAQDFAPVLAVATENATRLGVIERYTTLPGSAFDVDFGEGFDIALVPNLLHLFDAAKNIALLQKVRAALKPGGLLVIVEFAPNDDRITPANHAALALLLLATTAAGDTHTVTELFAMCKGAGFTQLSFADLVPGGQRMIIGRAP